MPIYSARVTPARVPPALLLRAAHAGNTYAGDVLVQWLTLWAPRWCRAWFQRGLDCRGVSPEDVAQDVCLAVLSGRAVFTPRPGSGRTEWKQFSHWCWTLCRNKCADAHRHPEVRNTVLGPIDPDTVDPSQGPEERVIRNEAVREASAAAGALLAGLRPQWREVVTLRVLLEHDMYQAAAMMGCSPGNVRVMQHRALRQLRDSAAVAA